MVSLDPHSLSMPVLQAYLSHAIAPRPVAFVSTVDKEGRVNLSPFSFFNVFSTAPPILIFSPARSGRTGNTKNTHDNVLEIPEAVVNMVSYSMVHQMSLSSSEYPKGVNEFVKSGFTMIDSVKVKPPRVAEAPVQMECKVLEVKEMGKAGGAGNLVICEIVWIHVREEVLNEKGQLDQNKLDLVGRLGANLYVRASGQSLFEVAKPVGKGIGVDAIPAAIRNSRILTGNNLGQLGNVEKLPEMTDIITFRNERMKGNETEEERHVMAKKLLDEGRVEEGWKVLLSGNNL